MLSCNNLHRLWLVANVKVLNTFFVSSKSQNEETDTLRENFNEIVERNNPLSYLLLATITLCCLSRFFVPTAQILAQLCSTFVGNSSFSPGASLHNSSLNFRLPLLVRSVATISRSVAKFWKRNWFGRHLSSRQQVAGRCWQSSAGSFIFVFVSPPAPC